MQKSFSKQPMFKNVHPPDRGGIRPWGKLLDKTILNASTDEAESIVRKFKRNLSQIQNQHKAPVDFGLLLLCCTNVFNQQIFADTSKHRV